jgi:hypothetical protein
MCFIDVAPFNSNGVSPSESKISIVISGGIIPSTPLSRGKSNVVPLIRASSKTELSLDKMAVNFHG